MDPENFSLREVGLSNISAVSPFYFSSLLFYIFFFYFLKFKGGGGGATPLPFSGSANVCTYVHVYYHKYMCTLTLKHICTGPSMLGSCPMTSVQVITIFVGICKKITKILWDLYGYPDSPSFSLPYPSPFTIDY